MTISDLASLGSFVSGVAAAVTPVFPILRLRQSYMSLKNLNAIYLFKQRSDGAFDPNLANQILGFTAAMFKMKGGQQWWDLMRRFTVSEFQAHMDGLIETAAAAHDAMPWFAADGVAGNPAETG